MPRREDHDDGRTVAPMNVEGMPWYQKDEPAPHNPNAEKMSRRNLLRYALSAMGTGVLIALAFGVAGAVFIWFCVNVWFR